jgi:phospholipid-binding lipoprotein MlaA
MLVRAIVVAAFIAVGAGSAAARDYERPSEAGASYDVLGWTYDQLVGKSEPAAEPAVEPVAEPVAEPAAAVARDLPAAEPIVVEAMLLVPVSAAQIAQDASEVGDDMDDISDMGDYSDGPPPDDGDPIETFNRFMFAFNDALDTVIVRPVAVTYGFWVPEGVRDSIRNFLRNLSSPLIFVNDVFQGEFERAEVTGSRFFINTILGLGFFDHAEGLGLPYHDEDFGQTLAVYGMGEGFYLVLPLVGPSSGRDALGLAVDFVIDPTSIVLYNVELGNRIGIGRAIAQGVDSRSRNIATLDEVRRDSLDYYVRIRSLWRQQRQNDIENLEPFSTSNTSQLTVRIDRSDLASDSRATLSLRHGEIFLTPAD